MGLAVVVVLHIKLLAARSGKHELFGPSIAPKVVQVVHSKYKRKTCLFSSFFLFFYRFKNVLFEIAATDTPGVFDLSAKFMGVNMEKVELIFQVCTVLIS